MDRKRQNDVCVNKIGDAENQATEKDIRKLTNNLKQTKPSDTEMLDWLQANTKGYGKGWICRNSISGRGLRVHETSIPEAVPTVRDAIAIAMREGI